MDGSDHYRKAEQLAAKAEEHLRQGDGQAAAWTALAQVHATLALATAPLGFDSEQDPPSHRVTPPMPEDESGRPIEISREAIRAAVENPQQPRQLWADLKNEGLT
jgi:hypothetical protein